MNRQGGFTYLTVMFIVMVLLGGLAMVGEMWENNTRREKEAELLFIGNQYRRAIGLYYDSTPGPAKRYPRTLDDLIKDPRQPSTQRHLRKLYLDPVSGKEFLLVKAPDGGIQGVHSPSEEIPLKVANFRVRDASFEGAGRYADWKFIHVPTAAPNAVPPPKPGAKPGAQSGTQSTPQPVLPRSPEDPPQDNH